MISSCVLFILNTFSVLYCCQRPPNQFYHSTASRRRMSRSQSTLSLNCSIRGYVVETAITRLQQQWTHRGPSVTDDPPQLRTRWLRAPKAASWAGALLEIAELSRLSGPPWQGARAFRNGGYGAENGEHLHGGCRNGPSTCTYCDVTPMCSLWFGSFVIVALFTYFMAMVYAS